MPKGEVRRLQIGRGFQSIPSALPRDGKHLAFRRSWSTLLLLSETLANDKVRVVNPRRLVSDDNLNFALTWTPDSRESFFRRRNRLTA